MRSLPFIRRAAVLAAASIFILASRPAHAAEGEDDPLPAKNGKPVHYVAPASDEAAAAIKQFALPAGWKVDLFAAEPLLANPVCLSIDDKGRVYVVETFRRRNAVLDIRKLQSWLDEDLACRTVADRIAMVKRHMPNDWQKLEGVTDRIRLLEDKGGSGHADHDTVFADKFDKLEDGTAAGILPWGDSVYFTDIPNLWKLKDTKGTGVADVRESLAYGFGVRYNYSGHDFHGLRMGPDGRIYFSIADRGLHVEKAGKTIIDNPDSGAVMRCELDGSNLELVHTGLRNPQELAFDEYGNLFTGDNNSDAGDPTRWVYVVDGGDSGWHVGWQWLGGSVPRGPWMSEQLCQVETKVPVYYRLPPVATPKIAGPAGLTYSPGVGLPKEWEGRFLLVDFRGGATGGSGIYGLKNKAKGASFELEEMKPLVTNVLPTDVEFGPDGRIYFTDWVTGWEPHGKGRIYTLTPPGGGVANKAVAEVKKLLAEGFDQRPDGELAGMLGHADVRVRMRAQFALAARGGKSIGTLSTAANSNAVLLARIHAIWGLGQIARKTPGESAAAKVLVPLLQDGDPEVKSQTAKMLGDARVPSAAAWLGKLQSDRFPRPRFFAAVALGKIADAAPAERVLEMLRKNNDKDAYLRHAGMMALLGMNNAKVVEEAAKEESAAVRVAALLVYRRQHSPKVAQFLNDGDLVLQLEAARAINDLPIAEAMPQLAALVATRGLLEPTLNRALNANYRLGTPASAQAIAGFAARADGTSAQRAEAIKMLAAWAKPSGRDRVTGLWRPVPERDEAAAKQALAAVLDKILQTAPDAVRIAGLNAATLLGINTTPLMELVENEKNPAGLRAAALAAMGEKKDKKLPEAAWLALKSKDETLRLAAIRVQPNIPDGFKTLNPMMAFGSPRELQTVFQTIAAATTKDKEALKDADGLLSLGLTSLISGGLAPEAHLDLLQALARKKTGKLADRHKAYEADRAKFTGTDPLVMHRETLFGGDAERGAAIFRDRADVSCMRCHAIKGVGGNAGPDLAGLLTRAGGAGKGREYILESILYPSKKIAQGFETVALHTTDGDVIAGLFKGEDASTVTLEVPNQGQVKVEKSRIKKREGGLSAMPDDISKALSKEDLRDLVEYLAGA